MLKRDKTEDSLLLQLCSRFNTTKSIKKNVSFVFKLKPNPLRKSNSSKSSHLSHINTNDLAKEKYWFVIY